MHRVWRTIALVLMLAVILPMLLACGDDAPDPIDSTTVADEQTSDPEAETTTPAESGKLEDVKPELTPEPEKEAPPANPSKSLSSVSKEPYNGKKRGCQTITVLAKYAKGVDYDVNAKKNETNSVYYLFLPCRADLTAITYSVTHYDGSVTGPYTVNLADQTVTDNEKVSGNSRDYTIIAKQSNLPSMMIQIDEKYVTIGQMNNDPNHKTFTYGEVVTTVTDEMAKENGWATRYVSEESDSKKPCTADMRGRGNWTWKYKKRSYQIRYENSVDLLGMGRGKAWSLLAVYNDSTGIRTQLAHQFGLNIGVHYTSDHRMIDLFLNGTYMGMFVVTEKVEVAPNRVEINEEKDILFEVDQYYEEQGEYGISLNEQYGNQYNFRIHSPTTTGTSEHSKQILKTAMAALNSGNEQEFLKYFDLDSWARMLLLQLCSMNQDAYNGSFFFYYNHTDGKMYACAPWDFDWSFGNGSRQGPEFHDPYVIDWTKRGLSGSMLKYPIFLRAVASAYYEGGVREEVAKMPALARYYGELNRKTIDMNALGAAVNYVNGKTISEALDYLYSACEKRITFMEKRMKEIANEGGYQIPK